VKYKKIQVYGHQRSGTHYVSALIERNFFEGSDYLRHYAKNPHALGFEVSVRDEVGYIYVWRDVADVLKSIYKMKSRFSLNADSFDAFLGSNYSDMWDPSSVGDFKIKLKTLGSETHLYQPAGARFRNQEYTPEAYWKRHVESWTSLDNKNIHILKYEDLIGRFETTMRKLSDFLGRDRTAFVNVTEKVGWIPLD
jgi:hypothetical protein